MSIKPFDIRSIGRTGIINPEQIGYQDSLDIISEELHRTRRSFVKIGWYLKHIREKEMYKEENYANIYELASDKFNLSQPTATRFMNICEQFSIGHDSPELDEQYIDFNMSQLFEMLPMKQEEMSQITPDMTIAQIRDFKKKGRKETKSEVVDVKCCEVPQEPKAEVGTLQQEAGGQPHDENWIIEEEALSAYGLPKTVYPEGSLLTTEGCGNKHDCFSCAMDGCDIRQKSRYCREAPLGNPFACVTMDVLDDIRWDGDVKDRCQFINDSMAYHMPGTGEADPCCKECQEVCDYRCGRSLKSIAAKKKKEEETGRPEMPQLKNDTQRKKWLRNYKEWGLWYRDENIDVNYYKYDFLEGSRLIVAEYPQRQRDWQQAEEDEYYLHLLEKEKEGHDGTRYNKKYLITPDEESYLVEFLKRVQI